MTLWQRFVNLIKHMYTTSKYAKPVEFGFWNPAKAKLRDGLAINVSEHRGKDFYVDGIREYTRTYRNEKIVSTAYDVSHQPLGGERVKLRLLYMPLAEQDAQGRDYVVLLLSQTDAMEYNENLHNALVPSREGKEDKGEFQVFSDDGETLEENWWRVDDQRGPIKASVAVVKPRHDGQRATAEDIKRENVEYWDFNREIESEGGVKFKQYQFYEMATDRGNYMWGYRGEEVAESEFTWNFI
jgi:hypothetical protein